MPLFPPQAPVSMVLDGRPLPAYARAYVAGGRVFAPVDPLLTRLADRLWFEDGMLVVARDGRQARVLLARGSSAPLDLAYVPVGPVLRELGVPVAYDAVAHRLIVGVPARSVVATPTPFNPAAFLVTPNPVFTPPLPATPRPVWTGSPLPRRTALPFPPPA